MDCDFLNLTLAAADGELDSRSAELVHAHAATCPACQAELAATERDREALREAWGKQVASPALHARIASALDQIDQEGASTPPGQRRRPWMTASFRWGGLAGVACSGLVAALVLGTQYLLAGVGVDAVVNDHLTAMRTGALTEVISSDHHTVKPWFAGRADVSPVVSDHRAKGFALVGGRVTRLHRQRVAVMVYRHGQHTIDLYAYAARGLQPNPETDRRGYHVACWRLKDVAYCAVGDVQWSELRRFQALVQTPE